MSSSAVTRLCLIAVVVGTTACGGGETTELPGEAVALAPSEQAGLYGAAAAEVAGSLPEIPLLFIVVDRPAVHLGSVDDPGLLEPFDAAVLGAIEAGLDGEVRFAAHPRDGVGEDEYDVPLTTVPGDGGPSSHRTEGWVVADGALLVVFGVPYPAWGGGFTGGPWPSDAERSIDLNVWIYQSPANSFSLPLGIEERDGRWQVVGRRTMGTIPPWGGSGD